MKRDGNIIPEIIDYGNMSESFDQVLRGTVRKTCREGRELLARREEVIANLQREIADGSFKVTEYREREIYEYGKHRILQIVPMERRIGCHAIMRVVDRHLHRRFIRTTGASIVGRGTHDLMSQVREALHDNPHLRYAYQFDIVHFYDNVNHQLAKDAYAHVFKDKTLLHILGNLIELLPQGISFGLRPSQATGNLILSIHLDHPLKDGMGVRHFFRYCDDGLVLAETKAELWVIRDAIHEMLEDIGFQVKRNERIYPVTEGIDFVGYVIYPDHVRLRKRIKKKFAAKIKEVKSRKGWHYPGYHWAITEDGKKTQLMTEEQPSNGVKGYNGYAINVAWMGGISNTGKAIDNRTDAQKQSLRELLTELKHRYPDAKILGHRDISPDKNHNGVVDPWERIKECPCFDAITEYADIK